MGKKFITVYLLIVLVLVSGCSKETFNKKETEKSESKDQMEIYENKIKQLEEQNNEYEARNKTLGEEVDSYQEFIKEAINYIDEDKISAIAKNEFSYSIEVDGKPITDSKDIQINKGEFEILFSQKQSMLSTIISELSEKGSINGNYEDHLKIVGIEPTDIGGTDGTVVTAFIYEFKDVAENTDFKLELSNELKERLDLSINVINIHVK